MPTPAPASPAPTYDTAPDSAPSPARRTPDLSAPDLSADVVIVGGGLIGGSLAVALAGYGVTSVVVDGGDPAALVAAEADGRWSALALACQRMLEGIGVWADLAPAAQPILDIRVRDGDSRAFLHYWQRDAGGPMGHMVENRALRWILLERMDALQDRGLLTLCAPARLTDLSRDARGVTATLSDGRRIGARLVVGADGRGSQVRRSAGIGLATRDYGQTAVVLTVAHARPHRGCAVEHFRKGGPFAILPLPGDRSCLVWTERTELARGLLSLPEDLFQLELEAAMGPDLGAVRPEGPAFSYPLSLQHATRYTDTRLVLVGDAAHGMHPVAGQGMNYGLRDVAVLTEILVAAHRLGQDVGLAPGLADYARLRRHDNALILAVTDGLVRLFSNEIPPLAAARRLGLSAVDRLPPVKGLFMRHAMGTTLFGPMPRLMAGEAL